MEIAARSASVERGASRSLERLVKQVTRVVIHPPEHLSGVGSVVCNLVLLACASVNVTRTRCTTSAPDVG